MPGAGKVIRSGLRGGIRGVRIVRGRLRETGSIGVKGAVDFVGRNVQESEIISVRKTAPVLKACLQKMIGSDDVCMDEFVRAINRTVNVALSSEMHDGIRLMAVKNLLKRNRVTKVNFSN